MSDPVAEKRPLSLKRRLGWLLLVVLLAGGSLFLFEQWRQQRGLAGRSRALDESDPLWRLEEIEQARLVLPDARNSAVLCVRLVNALGPAWPDAAFDARMGSIPLAELLDAPRMALLEAEMTRLAVIREAARPLADMPMGRYPLAYAFNPIRTHAGHQQDARRLATLLRYEMIYFANKGDVSAALRSGRACVCAGRSMYDEPLVLSQLSRSTCIGMALGGVERSLALGIASEQELTALQKLLEDEEQHNSLLVAVRGEQGLMDLLFARLAEGDISPQEVSLDWSSHEVAWLDRVAFSPHAQFRRQRPIMLDVMTRAVENTRLPAHKQLAAEKKLEAEVEELGKSAPLVPKMVISMSMTGGAFRKKTAQVATMRTLLAVERYRMKHGKWPGKLEDVVPAFLNGVPLDPFDGKPLRFVRVPDGVVVYSVGPDGRDDGGKLDRENPVKAGTDLGFQLWDVAKRRQPASPVAPAEKAP